MTDWATSGTRLVSRILIRRRRKCISELKHAIKYCRNCGVHQ